MTAADRCLFIFEARTHLLEVMSSAVPQPEPILFPKPWEKYQPRLPVLAAEDRRGLPEAVSPHPIAVTSLAFDAQRGALITGDEQGNAHVFETVKND